MKRKSIKYSFFDKGSLVLKIVVNEQKKTYHLRKNKSFTMIQTDSQQLYKTWEVDKANIIFWLVMETRCL